MITKITSVRRLKEIFLENFVTQTDKVTKISDGSVMNAIAYGVSKIAQKAIKDVALLEGQIFVDTAYGDYLDIAAENMGVTGRFEASKSSTHIRLKASPGTLYESGVHVFSGSHGITFDLEGDVTINQNGFAYAKIRSQQTGIKSNVDAFTINQVTPVPVGHDECVNEYAAQYGRDSESDDLFRNRIKNAQNVASAGTIEKIKQVMMASNPDVLRVFYHGVNNSGQNVLAVASQNGMDFTPSELDSLANSISNHLSLTDLRIFGDPTDSIEVRNVSWGFIDIDFRVRLSDSADPDDVRMSIQLAISKYLDFRSWKANRKVEWDDLLHIVKSQKGVEYVPDKFFFPNSDIRISKTFLPRVRGFIMRDVDGNPILNNNNTVSPVFYANSENHEFRRLILGS